MSDTVEVRVPDIGGFTDVPVIEVLIKPGDSVKKDDSLVVLESDKASMEIPSTAAGSVAEVAVKPGDRVSQGALLLTLHAQADAAGAKPAVAVDAKPAVAVDTTPAVAVAAAPTAVPAEPTAPQARSASPAQTVAAPNGSAIHASPAIRRFARELGVALDALAGSGPRGRITRDDVQNFVKANLHARSSASGAAFGDLPAWPSLDFARFGPIERKPLARIKKLAGPNLHRNWLQIPHITNYDEADITDLEAFRVAINAEQGKRGGPKLTMLAFLVKAAVAALQRFPEFNASLDGDELIFKSYYNIGFAADTPNGLVVPVIPAADAKGLLDIARESGELAAKAREGKLGIAQMSGGTFTISSIGGIGGTAFTQIVNAPEVAILGAVRSQTKPLWNGNAFVPRLMLPLSVSYDHRVIDGAGAARFLVVVKDLLADFRRVLL